MILRQQLIPYIQSMEISKDAMEWLVQNFQEEHLIDIILTNPSKLEGIFLDQNKLYDEVYIEDDNNLPTVEIIFWYTGKLTRDGIVINDPFELKAVELVPKFKATLELINIALSN